MSASDPRIDSAPDRRVLDRVRGLLTKAESTEFPAEAEALTAKAQELMARHSIEQAMVEARCGASGPRSAPTSVPDRASSRK